MEVEMKIRGLMMDPVTNMPIVVLKDVNGSAILPIWVGIYEANAIALEIEKMPTPRPMTHDLIRNLLFGLETGVKKVVVSDLKDDTFYAIIWLERDGRADLSRFTPQRRPGHRSAPRLPDFRRRSGAQNFEERRRGGRSRQQRGTAQVARESQRRGSRAATRCKLAPRNQRTETNLAFRSGCQCLFRRRLTQFRFESR